MVNTSFKFFAVLLVMLTFGFFAIYSSGFALSVGINSDQMLVRHCLYVGLAMIAFYVASKIDYHHYQRIGLYGILFVILLLVLVLIPGVGREVFGARRWLSIGGISFQPTEIAKVISIIYLAGLLCKKQDQLRYFWKGFVGSSLLVGFVVVLIAAEPDLGNAILLSATIICMLQISGFKWKYFSAIFLAAMAGIIFMISRFDHIMNRIEGFMHPEKMKATSGYQSYMAMTSIGSGGIGGVGLGEGQIKLHYLPFVNNDFIVSLIGEELGLMGMGLLLLLLSLFVFFGLKIALNSKDLYGTLITFGLIFMVGLQSFFHIGVNLSILPTKGISMPFISYGGTSLIVLMASMGIVYNIALQGRPRTNMQELGATEIPYRIVSQRKKAVSQ